MAERCPTCGGAVRAVTADEGTSYYVPVGADRENVAEAIKAYMASVPALPDGLRPWSSLDLADAVLAAIEAQREGEQAR